MFSGEEGPFLWVPNGKVREIKVMSRHGVTFGIRRGISIYSVQLPWNFEIYGWNAPKVYVFHPSPVIHHQHFSCRFRNVLFTLLDIFFSFHIWKIVLFCVFPYFGQKIGKFASSFFSEVSSYAIPLNIFTIFFLKNFRLVIS